MDSFRGVGVVVVRVHDVGGCSLGLESWLGPGSSGVAGGRLIVVGFLSLVLLLFGLAFAGLMAGPHLKDFTPPEIH